MIAREPTLARLATAQSLLLAPYDLDEAQLRRLMAFIEDRLPKPDLNPFAERDIADLMRVDELRLAALAV